MKITVVLSVCIVGCCVWDQMAIAGSQVTFPRGSFKRVARTLIVNGEHGACSCCGRPGFVMELVNKVTSRSYTHLVKDELARPPVIGKGSFSLGSVHPQVPLTQEKSAVFC